MKKRIAILIVVVVVALVAAWRFWPTQHAASTPKGELRATMRDEYAPRPLVPSVALQVNGTDEATIFPATPVWFSVSVANAAAANEAASARVLESRIAHAGGLSADQVQALKQAYERKKSPAKITLGDAVQPWTSAVSFVIRDAKGGETPLSFAVTAIGRAKPQVELDPANSTTAWFGAAKPEVQAGTYDIAACVADTGSWKGRACSPPAKLTVGPRPDPLTAEQQTALERQAADFGLLAGDFRPAESYGRKLLDADPQSVTGHLYLGEALLGQQKKDAALAEFTTARAEYIRQHPDALERPRFLDARIRQILRTPR